MTLGVLGPARLVRYPYSAAANGVGSLGRARPQAGLGVIDYWCWNIPAVKTCHDTKAVPYAQQQCAAAGDTTKACIDGHAESYLRKNCGCPAKDPKKTGSSSSPVYAPKPTTTEELEPVEPTIFGIPQKLVMIGAVGAAAYFFLLKPKKKAA
jgi:hypothetical protein